MKRYKSVFTLLATILFAACSKYSTQKYPVKTYKALLTQKAWRLVSYGVDVNNNGLVDTAENEIKLCEKDNTYSFAADGTGILNENGNICEGKDSTSAFEWSLKNDDKELDFVLGNAVILTLSDYSMTLGDKTAAPHQLLLTYEHSYP